MSEELPSPQALKRILSHLSQRAGSAEVGPELDPGKSQEDGQENGVKLMLSILRDFYRRMSRDAMLGFFFVGKNSDTIADRQADFLLRAMGARPSYSGKPPALAHAALPPILPGHFDRRLRILDETLRAHALPDEDIQTWLSFENAFRDGIVG